MWTPEPFEADDGTVPFERFVNELSDFKFIALETAIDRVLSIRVLLGFVWVWRGSRVVM
jgi:hypothetical protein